MMKIRKYRDTYLRGVLIAAILVLQMLVSMSDAFMVRTIISQKIMVQQSSLSFILSSSSRKKTNIPVGLEMADVRISLPSSDDAASMGIREWPQVSKTGSWQEDSVDGKTLTRYILDGSGTLIIEDDTDKTRTTQLKPGTLIEVEGKAVLSWKCTSSEMVMLTPGFEEGNVFIVFAFVVVALFGSLLAFS
jgi:hypothetical protein